MRVGYACKYMVKDQTQKPKILNERQKPYNTRSTTITWLSRQTRDVAVQRVHEIVTHNIKSIQLQLEYLAPMEQRRRMVRIGSDVLPAYTHPDWSWIYKDTNFVNSISKSLSRVGDYARKHDIRLSFHPGQFCVLSSDRPDVVGRSIEEFEYHVDLIRWMGYGKTFQDFKCNIHIGGKRGPEGMRDAYKRLSPEARNTITLENDEMSWGLNSVLATADIIPVVLDIHHHWVRNGEYIQPDDERVQRVIDSWRGVRPVIHYSYSRDEWMPDGFKHDELPDMDQLLVTGHKKQKLRAHSDWYPNALANNWALSFLPKADIMCESKMKNLARDQLLGIG